VEGTAEDTLGRGQKGNREMEEPLEGREREERRAEAEELGAEVEEPLFLPTPVFMAFAEEEQGLGGAFLCTFFCLFLDAAFIFRGIGLGGGQREACNEPLARGQWRGSGQKCTSP
jgi:hypothetical protein